MKRGSSNAEYIFHFNHGLLSDKEYWECFSFFMAYFFVQNTVSQEDVQELIKDRHEKEKIMDHVSSLMLLYQSVYFVLGDKFKYSIRQWQKADDKIYPCLTACTERDKIDIKKHISSQQNMTVYTISSNMQLWDGAKWSGVGFIFDKWLRDPPVLALLFRNVQDGKNIVKEWKERQAEGKFGIESGLLWSWGGTVFQTAVTICCINPETSSRVTLASLGTGFQPGLHSLFPYENA